MATLTKILLLSVLFIGAHAGANEVFSWKNPSGSTSYSDVPAQPPAGTSQPHECAHHSVTPPPAPAAAAANPESLAEQQQKLGEQIARQNKQIEEQNKRVGRRKPPPPGRKLPSRAHQPPICRKRPRQQPRCLNRPATMAILPNSAIEFAYEHQGRLKPFQTAFVIIPFEKIT